MKNFLAFATAMIIFLGFAAGCAPKDITEPVTTPEAATAEPVIADDKEVTSLRVNYETAPDCVEGDPVFSWIINVPERGVLQTNYRIRVAVSEDDLKAGKLKWDSGVVESDENVGVKYSGGKLGEAKKYYWDVTVNTNKEKEYTSNPSSFVTALNDSGFDGASWITVASGSADLRHADWIWLMSGDSQGTVEAKTEYFKKRVNISSKVKSAVVAFTGDDFGEFYVNGKKVIEITEKDGWQSGQLADITEDLVVGENLFASRVINTSLGYGGMIASISVVYEDGTKENFSTDGTWLATDRRQSGNWFGKNSSDSNYKKVNFTAFYGDSPWYENVTVSFPVSSAPMVRGSFSVQKNVKNAFLFASAAGLYDAYVNGVKVDNSALNPGRSEYQIRTMYQCFDVTSLLKDGENAMGAVLGRGWFIGAYSCYGGIVPAFICKLVVEYDDGSTETFCSGKDWKVYLDGPVLYNDIFNGETYDSRKEVEGWCEPGFNGSGWEDVTVTDANTLGIGELVPQLSGKVKIMDVLTAKSVSKVSNDTYIYDFGQNLAGVPSVTVKGKAGTVITLRHGEMLNDGSAGSDGPKGTLYTQNLRSALATDKYTMKGASGGETYTPSFTFHGFRYLEIKGLTKELDLNCVKAYVLYSDLEDTGSVVTSDELLNKLVSNTYWGQRGNFLSTPTDCPQRDERMGWSGDAQIFAGTAAYNMNVKTFFDKYITDLNDCQHSDGSYPDVAPETGRANYGGSGNNAWGDAGVIIPWVMYERYGDISYIEKYYANMKRYGNYLVSTSSSYIRSVSAYGDWLSIDETTPVNVTDTAYCVRVFDILEKMARLLGKVNDADTFAKHAKRYREAFIGKFVKKAGRLTADTQTAYLVALAFDILPEESRQAMADRLNDKIVKKGVLTTGFIGCSLLLPVLVRFGHADTAFMLLQNEEYPSWKYPILQGATTIWERWNSYTIAYGFGDAGMNSFNHYSYGSVTEWIYDSLCGITQGDGCGFKNIVLKPVAGGGITSVEGYYDSIRGLIKSSWIAENDQITQYSCTVPANTTARLYLSADRLELIKESGMPLGETEGVKVMTYYNGYAVIALGSGEYTFTIER